MIRKIDLFKEWLKDYWEGLPYWSKVDIYGFMLIVLIFVGVFIGMVI